MSRSCRKCIAEDVYAYLFSPRVRGNFATVILAAIIVGLMQAPSAAQQYEGRTIAAVTVTGLRTIKEGVVLEQIESRPGQPYRQAVADEDVVRLDRLGVFGDITLTPVVAGDALNVNVIVVETLRVLPVLSMAVTDENGFSAGPALKLLSLRGQPHEISVTARFGGSTLFEFSETSPELTRAPLWHSAKLAWRDRFNKLDEFNEQSIDLDSRAGRRVSERLKAGAIFQLYQVRSDQSGITLSPDNVDTLFSAGGVAEYDGRNSRRDTSHGWWNSADAFWRMGTGGYATLDIDLRRYQRLARQHGLVATSLLTLQSGSTDVVPSYADYALGGSNTVRGWAFNARRGKNQFISSMEYRYTALETRTFRVFGVSLYAGLVLAAFGDAGTAWSQSDDFSDGFIAGGGIGLRIFVPFVNMIRLDFALGDGNTHAHFGINEKAVAQRNRVR
jgi:outer membrane protein assembly factor BamA